MRGEKHQNTKRTKYTVMGKLKLFIWKNQQDWKQYVPGPATH